LPSCDHCTPTTTMPNDIGWANLGKLALFMHIVTMFLYVWPSIPLTSPRASHISLEKLHLQVLNSRQLFEVASSHQSKPNFTITSTKPVRCYGQIA
jgi:hypothetical protein